MVEPASKRSRMDDLDPINPDPSPVIHLREVHPKINEADLLEAFSMFGKVAYALIRKAQSQAYVEFETLEEARSCIEYSRSNKVMVAGVPVLVNYSTSKAIQRMGFESATPNHVLVLHISNLQYPINADTLYEICQPHGDVLRIAIVKRLHFITALVEYGTIEMARTAKYAINGADIYQNCCTLKVEYATADHVMIKFTDSDHKDYSGGANGGSSARKTLIPANPGAGDRDRELRDPYGGGPSAPPSYGIPRGRSPPPHHYGRGADYLGDPYSRDPREPPRDRDPRGLPPPPPPSYDSYGYGGAAADPYGGYPRGSDPYYESARRGPPGPDPYEREREGGGGLMAGGTGCVIMVYGIDQTNLSCDKMFNVLCQYGNVLKVKFMRHKQDTAMVEMGTPEQASNVITYLQGLKMYGMALELKRSRQFNVKEIGEPFPMADESPSFRDFTNSRHQRFATPDLAMRNRLIYPTNTLHWYNAPPEMDDEKIMQLLQERGSPQPVKVVTFETSPERSSSARGTVEFATVEEATEALAAANHTPVNSIGAKAPYIVKFAFTTSRSGMDDTHGPGSSRGGYRGRGGRGRGGFRGGRGGYD